LAAIHVYSGARYLSVSNHELSASLAYALGLSVGYVAVSQILAWVVGTSTKDDDVIPVNHPYHKIYMEYSAFPKSPRRVRKWGCRRMSNVKKTAVIMLATFIHLQPLGITLSFSAL